MVLFVRIFNVIKSFQLEEFVRHVTWFLDVDLSLTMPILTNM